MLPDGYVKTGPSAVKKIVAPADLQEYATEASS